MAENVISRRKLLLYKDLRFRQLAGEVGGSWRNVFLLDVSCYRITTYVSARKGIQLLD